MKEKPRRSPRSNLPYILISLSILEVLFSRYLWKRDNSFGRWTSVLVTYKALSTFIVAVSQLVGYLGIFGKSSQGALDPLMHLINGPYSYFYRTVVYGHRMFVRDEPVSTYYLPGFYLSGWFDNPRHARSALLGYEKQHGPLATRASDRRLAVLDLTCELPRVVYDTNYVAEYLCVPTFDRCAPNVDDLEDITQWVLGQRQLGREVVIHCAFGHGRSATCLIAAMLASKQYTSIVKAEEMLKRSRPLVDLTSLQVHILNEWLQKYHPNLVVTSE